MALEWSNRAYAEDPNDAVSMSLLAYSLVMEGQPETIEHARALVEQVGNSQIAEMGPGSYCHEQGAAGMKRSNI